MEPSFESLVCLEQALSQGKIIKKYTWHGQRHSVDDRPAEIIVSEDSDIVYEAWYSHGIINRAEHLGPAEIRYHEITKKKYYQNGILHRARGPAITSPLFDEWWWHGCMSRTDGPAKIMHTTGELEWWINGRRCQDMTQWGILSGCDPETLTMLKLQYG